MQYLTCYTCSILANLLLRKHICLCVLSLCVVLASLGPAAYSQSGSPTPPQGAVNSGAFASTLNAATQGDIQAQLTVAKAYNEGIAVRTNYNYAFKWFQAASDQGNVEANAWLGSLYLFGRGVPQDLNHASQLIQSAANSQNPVGLRFLGVMYQDGQGVAQSYAKALQFYSKASSLGDPNAFDKMGLLYYRGLGVRRNMRMALRLFTKGASVGDPWAEFHLGQMYESGHVRADGRVVSLGPGNSKPKLTPDYTTALRLYTQSAANGNRLAAYRAGAMYDAGSGVPQNYEQAFVYYRKCYLYAPALLALGRLHELGLGTSVNLVDAYIEYSLAARKNANSEAADRLRALARRLTPDQLATAKLLLQQSSTKQAK